MSGGSWKRVARVDEVRGAGPHAVAAGERDVVLVRTPAGLRAYEGRCPHRGALLGEGELEGGVLVCRNHRWRFEVETGKRDGGPECLATCAVREEGGEILVDVSALADRKGEPKVARRHVRDLPGPRPLPLLGNALALELDRLHLQLEAWGREHGTPYRFSIGPRDFVVFAEMVREELSFTMMPVGLTVKLRPRAATQPTAAYVSAGEAAGSVMVNRVP